MPMGVFSASNQLDAILARVPNWARLVNGRRKAPSPPSVRRAALGPLAALPGGVLRILSSSSRLKALERRRWPFNRIRVNAGGWVCKGRGVPKGHQHPIGLGSSTSGCSSALGRPVNRAKQRDDGRMGLLREEGHGLPGGAASRGTGPTSCGCPHP